MISESVSDLEKSGGSAPSICIDVLDLVHRISFDCTVGYMMHQVLSEFVNLYVEKHFYSNSVNFLYHII